MNGHSIDFTIIAADLLLAGEESVYADQIQFLAPVGSALRRVLDATQLPHGEPDKLFLLGLLQGPLGELGAERAIAALLQAMNGRHDLELNDDIRALAEMLGLD